MDVYQIITDRIIEKLEAGTVPWHKPWRSIGAPRNLVSTKLYRGVNVWLLTMQGYTSPHWATFRQINELGGSVRKGEKATPVVFWRVYVGGVEVKAGEPETQEHSEGQKKRRFVLRYYSAFNTEQCDLPVSVTEKLALPEQRQLDPIEACEKILCEMPNPPEIVYAGDKAFYSPATDRVTMPPRGLFESAHEFWCTMFHEACGHATGHEKRLNRDSLKEAAPFGSPVYSAEEVVAEMTAAYLCGIAGIENRTIDNSAAYIAGWLKTKLREDRKFIVHAATQAQRACDYVLSRTPCSD
jgi:antirestriction protein ArdC